MAVTVGINSWVTPAQVDAHFASRLGSSPWYDLPDAASEGADTKEAFIVTAFYWLLFDAEYNLSADADNENIRHAQFEAIYFLLNYREEYEAREAARAGGVTSMSASKWSESLDAVRKPASVRGALARAGVASSGGMLVDLEVPSD